MKITIIILIIFGIIFSRDIYFLSRKFLKLLDTRLFFISGLIIKGVKYLFQILSNIFNLLDKKLKLNRYFSLIKSLWDFDFNLDGRRDSEVLLFVVIYYISRFFKYSLIFSAYVVGLPALLIISLLPIWWTVQLLTYLISLTSLELIIGWWGTFIITVISGSMIYPLLSRYFFDREAKKRKQKKRGKTKK